MNTHNTYITFRPFIGQAICGALNLPEGTECETIRGYIFCQNGPVCAVTSQNAYDYFAQNDDGQGAYRGKLTQSILQKLRSLKENKEENQKAWEKIWNDKTCLKYKRPEHSDYWVWSYDFYNAEITELEYIQKLVMKE